MEKYGNIFIDEVKSSYTRISNELINNEKISPFALGVYCKIMCLGKSWQLNIKGLAKTLGESDGKVRAAMKSLESEGYMTRTPVHSEGKLRGWDYNFHHVPVSEDDKTRAGLAENDDLQCGDDNSSVSDFRQHCFQTTLISDNTENGEDTILKNELNIYNEDNNKNEIKDNCRIAKKAPEWKTDFDYYLSLIDAAINKLMSDVEYKSKFEHWYVNVDYERTLMKTADWWRSEDGWVYAKKKRTSLDMNLTLKRNMDRNRIYKPVNFESKVKNKVADVDAQLDLWRRMKDAEE